MSNSLDQLKATGTVVVCDSGDFASKLHHHNPAAAEEAPRIRG